MYTMYLILYNIELIYNQIIDEGQSLFIEVLHLINKEGMVEYQHFTTINELVDLNDNHQVIHNHKRQP